MLYPLRCKCCSLAVIQWQLVILIIKATRCAISQIYFWNRILHVSDRFSVHHQESSTVYTAEASKQSARPV